MSHSYDNPVNSADRNPSSDTAQVEEIAKKNEVTQLVDQLIKTKRITYTQYQSLSKLVLADGTVDEQERCQINRLFDAIQTGIIRIVEWCRWAVQVGYRQDGWLWNER